VKRVLVRLALVLGLFVGVAVPPVGSLAAAQSKQDPQTITVYVTRTGEKYHRDGCRYLSRNKIPMSLADAAKRFEPCKVCKPPVLASLK